MKSGHLKLDKINSKKITAVIQVRLGSTRLPGKSLIKIKGESLLGHLLMRVKASSYVNDIVIATTTEERDEEIVKFAKERDINYYRGSEKDVLDRFYKTCLEYDIKTIVRVTPDCPMLDPKVMDNVISHYLSDGYDYVSNTITPTFPDGLDTEVFSFQALEKTWNGAVLPSEREHVTPFMVSHPELFKLFNVRKKGEDLSRMRWTVDNREDLEFAINIFDKIQTREKLFYMEDVLEVIGINPDLIDINRHIKRNMGLAKSLVEDKLFADNLEKDELVN